jgi:cytochrome c oxidase subunit III
MMSEVHDKPVNPIEKSRWDLEVDVLGMWLFLVTEVMFFGGLFAAYTVYRFMYPAAFADASRHLDLVLGTVNTVILLTSSLTMALAVNSIQKGRRGQLMIFLAATMLLGTIFLVLKATEYSHVVQEHLYPGGLFIYPGPFEREARLFFSLYFSMTGLHFIHMALGILFMGLLLVLAWRGKFTPHRYNVIEMTGLYWHFVDIVWIFLFPLLYLIDRV